MPKTHISIRVTDQRRANLDALAAIIRSDSDTATIDFALGFALAHLGHRQDKREGDIMTEQWIQDMAHRIYQVVYPGIDSRQHFAENCGRIEDWLRDGDLDDNPSLNDLVAEWRAFDQPAETDEDYR